MKTVPGPMNRYPAQHLFRLQRDFLGTMEELSMDYPDICHLRGITKSFVILYKPEFVEKLLTGPATQFEKSMALQRIRVILGDGLLTAEGDEHLRRRRMVQPTFRKKRIQAYAKTMVKCALDVELEGTVNLHQKMMDLTLAVVSRTLLGADLTEDHETISRSLETLLGKFRYLILPFFPILMKLPLKPVREFQEARADLFGVVNKLLREPAPGSLVEMLLESDVRSDTIRDELLTMLLAGHETTANALTFAYYLLVTNPDKAKKMYDELDTVLNGKLPEASDYRRLSYTRQVLEETLRLYPPAWAVGRRALVDLDWGSYQIPRETMLLAPQWVLHRDERYFDRPSEFLPERWAEDAKPPRYAYFPFGGGTRICIGEGFARMEAVLILAVLGQRFRFELANSGPLKLSAGVTLRPANGLAVKVLPTEADKPAHPKLRASA